MIARLLAFLALSRRFPYAQPSSFMRPGDPSVASGSGAFHHYHRRRPHPERDRGADRAARGRAADRPFHPHRASRPDRHARPPGRRSLRRVLARGGGQRRISGDGRGQERPDHGAGRLHHGARPGVAATGRLRARPRHRRESLPGATDHRFGPGHFDRRRARRPSTAPTEVPPRSARAIPDRGGASARGPRDVARRGSGIKSPPPCLLPARRGLEAHSPTRRCARSSHRPFARPRVAAHAPARAHRGGARAGAIDRARARRRRRRVRAMPPATAMVQTLMPLPASAKGSPRIATRRPWRRRFARPSRWSAAPRARPAPPACP